MHATVKTFQPMLFYISVQKKNIFLQSTTLLLLIFVYQCPITFTLLL